MSHAVKYVRFVEPHSSIDIEVRSCLQPVCPCTFERLCVCFSEVPYHVVHIIWSMVTIYGMEHIHVE